MVLFFLSVIAAAMREDSWWLDAWHGCTSLRVAVDELDEEDTGNAKNENWSIHKYPSTVVMRIGMPWKD